MRLLTGGVFHIATSIEDDLKKRCTGLNKAKVKGLADLAATALQSRSCNSGEWMAIMPRHECDKKSKERYINRFLSNKSLDPIQVMGGFVPELIEMHAQGNKTVIIMMDQSKITNNKECLMISLRVGKRGIPIAWKVIETKGAIGFNIQKELLDAVSQWIPEDTDVTLLADRFYGTSALVSWCKDHGWDYLIRLKGNLIFQHAGGEITPTDAHQLKLSELKEATFNNTNIKTHMGILKEEGHPEPWFIAMSADPSKETVLSYGQRWGIEAMFCDFKSKGFGITSTHLTDPKRIERLILVLTIAMYFAVSTGMMDENDDITKGSKKNS